MLEEARRWKIPGLPLHLQHFLCCCLFHFGLPALPFLVEYLSEGRVTETTLTVGSAIYIFAIGVSSRNMGIFGISFIAGLLDVVLFGLLPLRHAHTPTTSVVWGTILLVVAFHFCERYNRHVMERLPYFEFMRSKEGVE